MEIDSIELIVGTYELTSKQKKKIINIAKHKINSLENFEEAYSYVSFLVERFYQTPYKEKFFTRLDSFVKDDSDTFFYELIKTPIPIKENNQRELKEKLKKLISKQEEPLIFLGRPVIQIEPFIKLGRRKYDKNNTPLNLYKAHPEFYKDKSRTKVFNDDPGMYESLRKWNQLHIAIPEVIAPGSTTKISDKKREKN